MAKAMEANVATGEVIERDMTAEELTAQELSRTESLARENEQESKIAARQAVLDRLGLTKDEAQLLLS
jgi:hypothetical protein